MQIPTIASIIIGVLGINSLGVKITSLILSGSGGMLCPALLLTAFVCLNFGNGSTYDCCVCYLCFCCWSGAY
jgi:TRAP-type uncharacterized transport system fused permease subunit